MKWVQRQLRLTARSRGCHLISRDVLAAIPEIADYRAGMLQVFIQHTSASLTVNENAEAEVRRDLAASLDALAPEDFPYTHTLEGPDDMPAHVKATLTGCSVLLPVANGQLALGTWQGIYLCEHRNHGGPRNLLLTLWGE